MVKRKKKNFGTIKKWDISNPNNIPIMKYIYYIINL